MPIYMRTVDGHCYRRVDGKYVCAYEEVRLYPHSRRCHKRRDPYPACESLSSEKHPHRRPTRNEWTDMLLRWKVYCTSYRYPDWSPSQVIQYVYSFWPFDVDFDPHYLERMMCFTMVRWHGKARDDATYESMFGLQANLICEDFIDRIRSGRGYWGVVKRGELMM